MKVYTLTESEIEAVFYAWWQEARDNAWMQGEVDDLSTEELARESARSFISNYEFLRGEP